MGAKYNFQIGKLRLEHTPGEVTRLVWCNAEQWKVLYIKVWL